MFLWQRRGRNTIVRNDEPNFSLPPPETDAPAPVDSAMSSPNPSCLQYEFYGKEWMQISQQENFDGFRFEAASANSKYLQTTHSLHMGTTMKELPYSYMFGPVFRTADDKTFLMAKLGLDRSVQFRAIQKALSDAVEMRVQAQSNLQDPQKNMYEVACDMNLRNLAGSLKLAHQGIWIVSSSVSQALTKNLHLGGDITVLWGGLAGTSIGSLGLRYVSGKDIWCAKLERGAAQLKMPGAPGQIHSLKANYTRKVSERLSLGSEFEYSPEDNESAFRLGSEYTFRTGQIQGVIDSAGKVSCVLQDMKGYGLSGMIDYVKEDYKFGLVMHHAPQDEAAMAAAAAEQQAAAGAM